MRHGSFKKTHEYLVRQLSKKTDIEIKLWLKINKYKDLRPDGYTGIYSNGAIIIKREGIIVASAKEIPAKYRVPTLTFADDCGNKWRVQPKVSLRLSHKIVGWLSDKCPKWEDSHKGNCGHLNGAPVIFDW